MKTLGLLSLLALCLAPAQAQVGITLVVVTGNEPVVGAFGRLEEMLAKNYANIIRLQQQENGQISALNRSIGDWGIGGPNSSRLQEQSLTQDYTQELGRQVVFDSNTKSMKTFKTAANQTVAIDAMDLDDYAQLDQAGQRAESALRQIATEIRATQAEVARTYAAMLEADPGGSVDWLNGNRIPDSRMSQQKYEKLRGKMQALNLHLQGLQSQQRAIFALLQGQATLTRSKQARDAEIAAQIQKANHVEQVQALSDLKFENLRWR